MTQTSPRFHTAQSIAFIFLIPGYFFYHWFGRTGTIPMVIGGYSNESSFVILAIIALWMLFYLATGNIHDINMNRTEVFYLLFMLFFSVLVILHWGAATAPPITISHTASLLQLAAIFVVFRFLPLSARGFHSILQVIVVAMSLLVYQSVTEDASSVVLTLIDESKAATYQALSRVFLLTLQLAVAFMPSRKFRIIHYLNGIVVIFLLGSRSEVVGLILFAMTLEFLFAINKGRILLAIALLTFVSIALAPILIPMIEEWQPDNRILSLLEFDADGSVRERAVQIEFALKSIAENPILGDYGNYQAFGGAGGYAHNILSAWIDLGIVGIGMVIIVFALAMYDFVAAQKQVTIQSDRILSSTYALGVGLLIQSIFFLLFAKAFTDVCVAVMVAVCGNTYAQLRIYGASRLAVTGHRVKT